jgi:hypothetical protein
MRLSSWINPRRDDREQEAQEGEKEKLQANSKSGVKCVGLN